MRKGASLLVVALSLSAAALLVSACGGGSNDNSSSSSTQQTTPTTAASGGTVKASLGEYFIKLDKTTVPSGDVKFDVANDGKIKHEFVVLKTNRAPGKLPLKNGEANEEAFDSPGEIGGIAPSKRDSLTVVLKPGKYVLICNLPGHYRAGQSTGLNVR